MKLIADPHKLRVKGHHAMYGLAQDGQIHERLTNNIEETFKDDIEERFDYSLRNVTHAHIVKVIETELIIDSVISNIIDQVILDRSPC